MPKALRKDIDLNFGHGCSPSLCLEVENQPLTVTIEGKAPIVFGDKYVDHFYCPFPVRHPVLTALFSPNITVNGRPLVREFDLLSCGDIAMSTPAPECKVIANGSLTESQSGQEEPGFGLQSYPEASYPLGTATYYIDPNTGVYQNGCPFSLIPSNAYTPILYGNTIVRNYPGPPITQNSGAVGLPPNAPQELVDPIKLRFILETGSPNYGFTLNEFTGEIRGTVTQPLSSMSFIVLHYYVGFEFLGQVYFPTQNPSSPFRHQIRINILSTRIPC